MSGIRTQCVQIPASRSRKHLRHTNLRPLPTMASSPPQRFKPISISLSSKSKSQINDTVSRKRPHSSLTSPDSDSDPEDCSHARPQAVSFFDHTAGGAIGINNSDKKAVKAPLVIPKQRNRNWREEGARRRGKNLLPAEVQALMNGEVKEVRVRGEDRAASAYGLTFVSREDTEDKVDVFMVDSAASTEVTGQTKREKTADEEAMEALLEGKSKSDLVLPALQAVTDEGWQDERSTNEDDQFRLDVASRPDSASLEAYTAVPVEEFGAGLLRGMGWKEGDVIGKRKDLVSKAIVKERRPALLGVGAKGAGVEVEAWNSGKGKKRVDIKTYNPVMLKNMKTGEMLTEEELKMKIEEQKGEDEDWRARRDRNLARDGERKRERERSPERKRDGSGRSKSEDQRRRSRRRDYGNGERSDRKEKDWGRDADDRGSSERKEKDRGRDSGDGDRTERKERVRRRRDDEEDHERKDRDRRRRDKYQDRDRRRDEEYGHREREDTRPRGRQEVY